MQGGRENTGRWTQEEHALFLEGLKLHGKGWKKIAGLIETRTVVQIRTHAQKYFQKLEKARAQGRNEVEMDCRGPSRRARKAAKKRSPSAPSGAQRAPAAGMTQSDAVAIARMRQLSNYYASQGSNMIVIPPIETGTLGAAGHLASASDRKSASTSPISVSQLSEIEKKRIQEAHLQLRMQAHAAQGPEQSLGGPGVAAVAHAGSQERADAQQQKHLQSLSRPHRPSLSAGSASSVAEAKSMPSAGGKRRAHGRQKVKGASSKSGKSKASSTAPRVRSAHTAGGGFVQAMKPQSQRQRGHRRSVKEQQSMAVAAMLGDLDGGALSPGAIFGPGLGGETSVFDSVGVHAHLGYGASVASHDANPALAVPADGDSVDFASGLFNVDMYGDVVNMLQSGGEGPQDCGFELDLPPLEGFDDVLWGL